MRKHQKIIGIIFILFSIIHIVMTLEVIRLGLFKTEFSVKSLINFGVITLYLLAGTSMLLNHRYQRWVCVPAALMLIPNFGVFTLASAYYFWFLYSGLNKDDKSDQVFTKFTNNPRFKSAFLITLRSIYIVSVTIVFIFFGIGIAMGFDSGIGLPIVLLAFIYILAFSLAISVAFMPVEKFIKPSKLMLTILIVCSLLFIYSLPMFIRLLKYAFSHLPI